MSARACPSLKPLGRHHAAQIQTLAADPALAATCHIPHPLPDGYGERVAGYATRARDSGEARTFAIQHDGELAGVTAIEGIDHTEGAASVYFWVGTRFQKNGLATTALSQLEAYAFGSLGLSRLEATSLEDNPASRRVLEKCGFEEVENFVGDETFTDKFTGRRFLRFRKQNPAAGATEEQPQSPAPSNGRVMVESGVRFSASQLWNLQREFFESQGIAAWAEQVPFYITSNPFLADGYAHVILRFVQDWVREHPESIHEPFYIFEPGAGSGRFSFYLLTRLVELQKTLRLEAVRFRYIMSDLARLNIEFWQAHPKLQPFLEDGLLDFALFDAETDDTILLEKGGECLRAGSLANPLICVGNYFFDTLRHDMFRVREGRLEEGLHNLRAPRANVLAGEVLGLHDLQTSFEYQPAEKPYPEEDDDLNEILSRLASRVSHAELPLPVGGLRCLRRLLRLGSGRMLLLAGDRGYGSLSELEQATEQVPAFHASFSLRVNFPAITEFFHLHGGGVFPTTQWEDFRTMVFVAGLDRESLVETTHAVACQMEGVAMGDYFRLYRHVTLVSPPPSLTTILACLQLSRNDPRIVHRCLQAIHHQLPSARPDERERFLRVLPLLEECFYEIPGSAEDIWFETGVICHTLGLHREAAGRYKVSIQRFGDRYKPLFNLGMCLSLLGDLESASPLFVRALKTNPECAESKQMVAAIARKMESNAR